MNKATAYVISFGIIIFGGVIACVGLYSNSPALWMSIALIPISVGIWSTRSNI